MNMNVPNLSNKLIWTGLVLLLGLGITLCSCERADMPMTPPITEPAEPVEIDPSDPIALSDQLIIPGSTEIEGPLPEPSDSATAPTISGNVPEIISTRGSTFLLPFQYSADNDLAGYYIQIEGADAYYDLPYTGLSTEIIQVNAEVEGAPAAPAAGIGNTYIPVGLPQNLGTGFFQVVYGVYDNARQTSNFLDTVINLEEVGTGTLQISLSWNEVDDIDLWVTDPSGFKIFYADPVSAATGGELDRDDVDSFGPENIFWTQGAPDGDYKVEVNYYAGSGAADYIVTINAPNFAQQFTGTLNGVGETDLIANLSKQGSSITLTR